MTYLLLYEAWLRRAVNYYVVIEEGKKKKKCAQIGKRASAAESVASAASAVSAECMSKVAC